MSHGNRTLPGSRESGDEAKETQVNRLGFYSCVLRLLFYINLTCGVMIVPYF